MGNVESAQSQIWPYPPSTWSIRCTPKVHSCSQSPQSQANCGVKSAAPAASGANSPSLLPSHSSFGLEPASSYRPPLISATFPDVRGKHQGLLELMCTLRWGRQGHGIHRWAVPGRAHGSRGFTDVVTDCSKSALLQRKWPLAVRVLGKTKLVRASIKAWAVTCTYSQPGGNCHLWGQDQWWHFVCYLRHSPALAVASGLCFPL